MFEYSDVSDECIKCAKCIPVCTIHQNSPDETTSPRGFLELLGAYEKGDLELDKNAKDIFESCFLCTNCVDVCPKDLPTDMMIEQARADIAQKYGITWFKKVFFYLLRHRFIMDVMFKLGYVFQTCGFKMKDEQQSLLPRFSLPIIKKDRLLPAMSKTSFLNKHAEHIDNGGTQTVAIFIGCLANYNYTSIGDSLLEVLKELKVNVFLAKKQKCCSAPAYFTGDFDTVDSLAKQNIEYFESFIDEVDAIIIPEATCSAMVKIDYAHYFHNQTEWAERSKKLNPKIYMATEWLEYATELKSILSNLGRNDIDITYHDPCHARKMQGIYEQPRTLLKQNYTIKEMSDPNQCCGFGGVTIQTEKFHLAQAAGKPKAAMIENTGAKYVSAECSACRMQLTNALYEGNVDTIFKNPIELIAEAMKSKI